MDRAAHPQPVNPNILKQSAERTDLLRTFAVARKDLLAARNELAAMLDHVCIRAASTVPHQRRDDALSIARAALSEALWCCDLYRIDHIAPWAYAVAVDAIVGSEAQQFHRELDDDEEILRECLLQLTQQQRRSIELRLEGYSVAESARRLDTDARTITVALSTGRRRLRQMLAQRGGDR